MMASAGAVLSGIMWLQQLHDHRWVAPVPYGPRPRSNAQPNRPSIDYATALHDPTNRESRTPGVSSLLNSLRPPAKEHPNAAASPRPAPPDACRPRARPVGVHAPHQRRWWWVRSRKGQRAIDPAAVEADPDPPEKRRPRGAASAGLGLGSGQLRRRPRGDDRARGRQRRSDTAQLHARGRFHLEDRPQRRPDPGEVRRPSRWQGPQEGAEVILSKPPGGSRLLLALGLSVALFSATFIALDRSTSSAQQAPG